MRFFRSLAELFPRFARRSGALERAVRPSLPSRRLRLEPLENRELLAVDAFAVPFGPPPLENVANEAAPVVVSASVLADDGATLSVRTETAEPVAPPSFEQLMESLGQVKIESLDAETDVASSSESEETQTELQPSFIVDGVEYYPLSQAVARRVVFEDSGVDVASLDEPFVFIPNANDGETNVYGAQSGGIGDSGGSGGEPEPYSLDLQVSVSSSVGELSTVGIENGLLERATSVSGGAAVDASFPENYLQVTLPALPDYYEAEVVLGGTATLGVDYEIHAPRNIFNQYYNNSSFTYSGGSSDFFVFPINDAQPESLEYFTATLGTPTPNAGSGGWSPPSYDFSFATSNQATATFVDDDHWKVSVEASDSTATERLADVEQDYGYYTFKREHQNPDVAAKIDAKIQELTEADATDAELDAVKELADLVTGDASYSVRVEFEAYYNPESNLDAALGDDYSLSTTPLVSENADAYLASFTAITSTIQTTPALARREYDGVIPASKTEALLRLNPVFDWEDEGDLFDPNCLINQSPAATTPDQDDSPAATTPDKQTGEKARLRLLNATWSGQGADYNPLAEPTTAAVDIKDGAIAELYFDYDGDGTLDPYQSTADETCYVPLNNDDDNENDVEDRLETALVANENDFISALAVAWLDALTYLTDGVYYVVDAFLNFAGTAISVFEDPDGTDPYAPTDANGNQTPIFVSSPTSPTYAAPVYLEGTDFGAANAVFDLDVSRVTGGETASTNIGPAVDKPIMSTPYKLDLDVDSDNNGYINNKTKNSKRADAEDAMEESVGKPITYFANASDVEKDCQDYVYVPINVNLQTTDSPLVSSDATNLRVSFSYTTNLAVYRVKGDADSIIESDVKKPFSEYLQLGADNEFYVRAINAASDTGIASGFDKIHVIVWDGDVEIHRDTVCFDVQDGSDAGGWIVPSGWRIGEDGSLTTPTPAKGAVGPQSEGSGVTTNKGDAYYELTSEQIAAGFEISFAYEFLRNGVGGYLQPDTNKNEQIDPADAAKLSFVGNSGVKFGGVTGVTEVAILDFCAMVDMVGDGDFSIGIDEIAEALVFVPEDNQQTIDDGQRYIGGLRDKLFNNATEIYAKEELFRLLHGVKYYDSPNSARESFAPNSTYNTLLNAALTQNTQPDYAQFLRAYYNLCANSNGMSIEFKGDQLKVYLKQKNSLSKILIYQVNGITIKDNCLYLQSHHGSGVRFSNVSIGPLQN